MANPWDFITAEEVAKLEGQGMKERDIRRVAEARMAYAETNPFKMEGQAVSGQPVPQISFYSDLGRGAPQGESPHDLPFSDEIPLRPELAKNIPLWQIGREGAGAPERPVEEPGAPGVSIADKMAQAQEGIGDGQLSSFGEEAEDPKKQYQKKYGKGLTFLSMGLGQMSEGAGAPSSKQMFGGMLTALGGIMELSFSAETQNSGWGKIGSIAAMIGTAIDMRGRRESARTRIGRRNRIINSYGKALRTLKGL